MPTQLRLPLTVSELKVRLPSKSKADLFRFIRKIPSYLSGESDPYRIGQAFWAAFTFQLYTDLARSYEARAAGGVDETGDKWRTLAPRTLRRRLSPRMMRRYPLAVYQLINRLSDRLFQSLNPGEYNHQAHTYSPRPDQIFRFSASRISLGSTVPYAIKVHSLRSLFPRRMQTLLNRASQQGLIAVRQRCVEVLGYS